MIRPREPHDITEWMLAFYPYSPTWYGRLVPGRFKHVALASFSARCDTWIFQEVCFSGVRTVLLPGAKSSCDMLGDLMSGCAVLKVSARSGAPVVVRGPLTCVSFAKHVIGASCVAASPTGLYFALIRQGAEKIGDHERFERRRRRWWRHGHDVHDDVPAAAERLQSAAKDDRLPTAGGHEQRGDGGPNPGQQ